MACWLEPHWRSTVVPGTDSGKPAARTALRATLAVCSPTCMTQPAITSSIRAGSSLLRETRPLSVKPSRSTGCHAFSIPSRRPSGVRTASTMTASLFILSLLLQPVSAAWPESESFLPLSRWLGAWSASPLILILLRRDARFLVKVSEAFAFFCQTLEQRRRLPEFTVLFMKFANAIVNFFQADRVCIPHGAATMRREAITGEIDDVDIDGAQRVAFFKNTRAFIDQRIDKAIDNLFFRDRVLLNTSFSRPLANILFYRGIKNGTAILIIFVPACAGFLTIAPHLAETILRQRLANTRFFQVLKFFANAPAHV